MNTTPTASSTRREQELLGQTVVVIGGSAGIGFETARRAGAEGARLILTARNPQRLQDAARELGALSTTAFDATDPALLEQCAEHRHEALDRLEVAEHVALSLADPPQRLARGRPQLGGARVVDRSYDPLFRLGRRGKRDGR